MAADERVDTEVTEPDDAPALDPELLRRRAEAIKHVRQFGDPVLTTSALPVLDFDAALRADVEWMGRIMSDSIGVGLAATQVGSLRRLLVYRVEQNSPVNALVNPELEWSSKDTEMYEEGCLSLPHVVVDVERPIHVRVRARDAFGEHVLVEASGLEARVIQHEIDHLDGILILDRAARDQRREAMRVLREALAE